MRSCFIVILFLFIPSWAGAHDFSASGYSEIGKRSTAEDYEEEDTDDNYTYRNFHLKLQQDISEALSYDLSSFIYNKDYQNKDCLDNTARISRTTLSFKPPPLAGESLDLDFKITYREKRYEASPKSEYDQLVVAPFLTFQKKDSYTLNLFTGIDNFDYLARSEKDQFKVLAGIEGDRYFFEKRLMVTSAYNFEKISSKNINRERAKNNLLGGFDYIFDLPWLYKMVARAGWGERDTKEEEERDDDYDYRYAQYSARTEHRLGPGLKTNLKYQYFKKDYLEALLDHHGYYLQDRWRYEILDNPRSHSYLDLAAEHKAVDYILKTSYNYKKKSGELKLTYEQKKRWQAAVSLQGNLYHYNDSDSHKKRYYLNLSAEKFFLEGEMSLAVELKYRYTDSRQKDDSEEAALRLAFRYKF